MQHSGSLVSLLAGIAVLALGGYWVNFSSGIDDAHITYWAGYAWSTLGAPLNYNLQAVEQSSSLLHTALIALLHYFTAWSPVTIGHVVTLIAAVLCLPLLSSIARKLQLSGVGAVLICSSAAAFSYWTFGGLETPLVALALLAVTTLFMRWLEAGGMGNAVLLSLVCLLTQLLRPELPLFLPALGAAYLVCRYLFAHHTVGMRDAWFLAVNLGIALVIFTARKLYFGDFFPQPVYAKVSLDSLGQLFSGAWYVLGALRDPWLCVQAIIGIAAVIFALRSVFAKQADAPKLFVVLLVCMHAAMVMTAGGDWMENYRFWAPITPFYALLCLMLFARLPSSGLRITAVAAITLMNLASTWQASRHTFSNANAQGTPWLHTAEESARFSFFERHSRDNRVNIPTVNYLLPIMQQLLTLQPEGLTVLSGQMGMVSYYLAQSFADKINFIDRNALVERTFTHCADAAVNGHPTSLLETLVRQQKHAQACNIKQPDVIFDIWTGAREADALQIFERRGYVPVFVQRGHLTPDMLQMVAIKRQLWEMLGKPALVQYNVPYTLFE